MIDNTPDGLSNALQSVDQGRRPAQNSLVRYPLRIRRLRARKRGFSCIVSARLGHASELFTNDTYVKSVSAADRGASDIVEESLAKLLDERGREKVAKGRKKVAKLGLVKFFV